LYALESSADDPPDVPDQESPGFDMSAGERREILAGVLGLEMKLPEKKERSPDEEDVSETLGVL